MHRHMPIPGPIKLQLSNRSLRRWEIVRLRTGDKFWKFGGEIRSEIWERGLDDAAWWCSPTADVPPRSQFPGRQRRVMGEPPLVRTMWARRLSLACRSVAQAESDAHENLYLSSGVTVSNTIPYMGVKIKTLTCEMFIILPNNIVRSKIYYYHNGSFLVGAPGHVWFRNCWPLKEVCFVVFTCGFCGVYFFHPGSILEDTRAVKSTVPCT